MSEAAESEAESINSSASISEWCGETSREDLKLWYGTGSEGPDVDRGGSEDVPLAEETGESEGALIEESTMNKKGKKISQNSQSSQRKDGEVDGRGLESKKKASKERNTKRKERIMEGEVQGLKVFNDLQLNPIESN